MRLELSFGSEIPDRYTEYGEGLSPEIRFRNVPERAESLTLVLENLSAPENKRVRWLLWNIPADSGLVPEGVKPSDKTVAGGALQENNDLEVIGYSSPKKYPDRQVWRFTGYALNERLELPAGSSYQNLRRAMKDRVLDKVAVGKIYRK